MDSNTPLNECEDEIIAKNKRNGEYLHNYVYESFNPTKNYYEEIRADYEFSSDRLTILKDYSLGCGHFGRVYLGVVRCNMTDRLLPVAVKMCKTGKYSDDYETKSKEQMQIDTLHIELNTLAYIRRLNGPPHPNLIRLVGSTTTIANEFCLMTEYCKFGSLERYLQEKYQNNQFINEIIQNGEDTVIWKRNVEINCQSVSENMRLKQFITTSDLLTFAEQIASAMEYLSAKNILHRDVALRNIFLKTAKTVKLGDFGLSRQLAKGKESYTTSKLVEIPIRYTALESLMFKTYSIESELWTFGVVLWELFTFAQNPPYDIELPDLCTYSLTHFLQLGNRLTLPDMAPRPIQKLMTASWDENARNRPNFGQCRSIIHSVFNDAQGTEEPLREMLLDENVALIMQPTNKKTVTIATKTNKRVMAVVLYICAITIIFALIAIIILSMIFFKTEHSFNCKNCEIDVNTTMQPCPDGWTYYRFTNSCYIVEHNAIWRDAQRICKANNSNLTSIHSVQENNFVAALETNVTVESGDGDDMTWIGLYSPWRNLSFAWIDGSPMDYTNWAFNEPNGDLGAGTCGQLFTIPVPLEMSIANSNYRTPNMYYWKWNDYACNRARMRSFVCKRAAYIN